MNDNNVSEGLGDTPPNGYGSWLGGPVVEPEDGDDHGAGATATDLTNHPAVRFHGQGVHSEHLADFMDELVSGAMDRVMGVGEANYAKDGVQAFELYDLRQTYDEFLDEIKDAYAYLAFAAIKGAVALRKIEGIPNA